MFAVRLLASCIKSQINLNKYCKISDETRVDLLSLNFSNIINPLSPLKMVKQTQTIRRQQPTNYLSESHHFVGLALKRLTQNVSGSHLLIIYAKLFKT